MIWKIINKIKGFLNEMSNDCIDAYSAQAAFFIMLSFIPFIMLILSLIKYTPVTQADFMDLTANLFPEYIQPVIISIIEEVYSNSVGILSLSIITAIWSSAKGFLSLNKGLNKVYDVEETRNYFYLRFRACLLTIILVVSIIMSLILIVFGNSLQVQISSTFPIISVITEKILALKTYIMPIVFVVIFVIIYTIIPNRKMKLRNQIPGAIICAIVWYGFSFFFSLYVDYSLNISKTYGSLSTLVLVMLWLYCCMNILLICAEINSYFEEYIAKLKLSKLKKRLKKIEKNKKTN